MVCRWCPFVGIALLQIVHSHVYLPGTNKRPVEMTQSSNPDTGCGTIAGKSSRTMKFVEFSISNNEAKYEALVASLKIAKEMGVRHLRVYNDSQLIVD